MPLFQLGSARIDPVQQRERLGEHAAAGAFVSFEGWVRDHHQGRQVLALNYEAHPVLAQRTGESILAACLRQPGVLAVAAAHRTGALQVGDIAVWVGVCTAHRDLAFAVCRELIDRIKAEVPIWKHEHYQDHAAAWVGADVVMPT